jgi:FixJ family two-component response regulator
LRAFVEQYPGYPVIVWSSQLEIPLSVEAMKLGAIDVLRKPLDNGALPGVLKGALHLAAQRLEESAEARNLARRYQSLPHSEKAVLALIMKGRTNKEVSHELDCSLRTVEAKRQRVLRTMQAENALELAAILSRHGLMDKALEVQTSPKSEDRVAKESSVEARVVAKPAPVTSAPHWGERVSQVS